MPCCSSRDKHSRHCGVTGTFSPISSKLFVNLLMCELNHEEARSSSQVVIYLITWKGRVGKSFRFLMLLFFACARSAFAQNTWLFVYICSSRCLCAHPLHSCRLWCVIEREAVGGCGAAAGKAVLRSRQSGLCNSHYHREQRKCFRLMLERFCLPCRRMMMEMIAGCVRFETFLMSVICWTCLDVTWICSILYKTLIFFDLIKMTEVGCSCIFLWYQVTDVFVISEQEVCLIWTLFVPAAVPGLSCMAALGTKAKWLCSAHKRVFSLFSHVFSFTSHITSFH